MASFHRKNCFIDPVKLRDYCLNANHPIGKHKARVFKAALSMTDKDAELLVRLMKDSLQEAEVKLMKSDAYGSRYIADLKIRNFDKEALVRTVWIVYKNDTILRLVTAYVNS
jgi:hypothetical protein